MWCTVCCVTTARLHGRSTWPSKNRGREHHPPSANRDEDRPSPGRGEAAIQSAARLLAGIIDRFGWPGAILILGYIFVERHGTPTQKQQLIDKFLINPELPDGVEWVVSVAVFAAIVVFQRLVYKQRDTLKDAEIRRLAEWKTEHQQAKLGAGAQKLHSSKDEEV